MHSGIYCAHQTLCKDILAKIIFSSLPFEKAWRKKSPEYKSQSMWQVQKDVWRFCFVLFCSLMKDLELPFECERERQVETKLWTKLTIKLASSYVCPIFGLETQSECM